MGVLDKFLDFMGVGNNDVDEEEFEDGFEDDFFEEEPFEKDGSHRNIFNRGRSRSADNKKEDDEDTTKRRTTRSNSNPKVTPLRQNSKRASMGVCVIKPTAVDEAREVVATLLEGTTIILNLEGMDLEVAQRIIDFTSGATVAIDGNLQKVSNFIFLVTPPNVDISGDLQDLLNSSFDEPSIKIRY